ncbi:MAG TPA: YjjG family noncanonical pyrimidine nucleotidase [Perlabentimonas sp.]|nr:YjjG family noncanonical pyrimidine nucleotidase [Bacteroidales bacterium]MDD4672884.1 YjjG family noncanonical pyrimidine nucleotidase [Bacteroidales bacterium]HZJ74351.1 YjjG family noncanonical pyrimidine nucleotidase [Perlabentimonas sp.]
MSQYKHIFFDLDRTLWDFEQNMRITLTEIYKNHNLNKTIPSPEVFIDAYIVNNDRLWASYQRGEMKKEVLRYKRFELTLRDFGIKDKVLASVIGHEYLSESPKKTVLLPNTLPVLNWLYTKYKLHIITNGFNEVQFTKLKMCGIEKYFDKVLTSEMSGYHKPRAEAFGYSLSSANAKKAESIMIGDDLETDIIGAKNFGIDQVYFNPSKQPQPKVEVTHEISNLIELKDIL